ncbi:hypothetical protein BOW53_01385 [Solemya pervernicosa gill symbiont]|uniref:FAD assembly factor SdhE n=2 Tax=Gammaproteobacteria incertae sedis TaxID=118884 RepID=A0A1T2LA87_9GAMM|nr:succinate dehydrogenase assembly factor 2 [Candidatus Reidiella endopervernicosa]OOZ42019.1 hypothetical protein BOW53_01385 [Solemya pervernicosa gill symbiont]QKQ27040.1 succinate dehydrogenase assembly factor 2 [Candidatus Reidiella endopervernicosa]
MSLDDDERKLARLQWQCRRGMRELDVLLRDYLDECYPELDDKKRGEFERLLTSADQELLEWLMGRAEPMDGELQGVVKQIRSHAQR